MAPTGPDRLIHPRLPYPVAVALLAALYFGVAKLSLAMAFEQSNVSPVWPPTGLSLAALLLLGRRYWPGIALGAFLTNASTEVSLATAGGIAIGNTLEALAGAYLLGRLTAFRGSLDRVSHVLALVILAAGLSTLLSATVGVGSLWLSGAVTADAAPSLWRVWWVGDAMGNLVVAPLLLTWAHPRLALLRRRWLEAASLVGSLLLVTGLVYSAPEAAGLQYRPLAYLTFPWLIWAALRFGQSGVTLATALVSGVAIWGTLQATGPFHLATATESLVQLQLFLAVEAITGLLLAAVLAEREHAEQARARLLQEEQAAHQAAQAAVAARDEFLGLAAHELKTPLTSVRVAAQVMAQAGAFNPRLMEIIQREETRLERLVDDLLDAARLESGQVPLRRREVMLPPLLRTSVERAQLLSERHPIRLEATEPGRPGWWDPDRVEQIVMNLLSNAVKYSPPDREIVVTLREEGPAAEIAVRDHGQGIPPDALPHIFERFYRVDHGRTAPAGLGLGLAITRSLVEAHGGQIRVESAEGQGSTFTVVLPYSLEGIPE
jgi:signal transduction histidine kinase